ncbi:MAG: membrane dipeptidase [Oscillospiraceae bacterium]|nr:membrane dipeptidase [Oscillospiraceae bacterium]
MRLFDLHCDTVTTCMKTGASLARNGLHWDLTRAAQFERWVQVFAIFVPDSLQGEAAWAYYKKARCFARQEIPADVHALLALENGNALCGRPERVAELASDGVRILTLTWNGQNELGAGAGCDPALPLTDAGCAVLAECWKHGVLPDASHLNEAGFWQVNALCGATPGARYIASHSCCAAVQAHPRNLCDARLRALLAAGGLLGLNLYPPFLGGAGDICAVLRHLEHLLVLGGAKRTALGSDFDGAALQPDLAGLQKIPALREAVAVSLGKDFAEDFFWGNAARFFGLV